MVDQVKVVADEEASSEQSLRRNLTNRHIQLIAIGGAIGTGLFMGSGKTISLAGPSIIFVYMIIGFMRRCCSNQGTIPQFGDLIS
ncbi:alanine glycine permease [Enterobacter sichuanensis]|nr:alanine glycine permease [Enterobacter sichuanensis]